MARWSADAKGEVALQLREAKISAPDAAQIDVGIQNVDTTPLYAVIAPLLTLLVDCGVIESKARLVQMRALGSSHRARPDLAAPDRHGAAAQDTKRCRSRKACCQFA